MPLYDGFYCCRDIRTASNVPIIFLSARNSDMDQVMAIENGGDDYITKPFSYDVLITKIKRMHKFHKYMAVVKLLHLKNKKVRSLS